MLASALFVVVSLLAVLLARHVRARRAWSAEMEALRAESPLCGDILAWTEAEGLPLDLPAQRPSRTFEGA